MKDKGIQGKEKNDLQLKNKKTVQKLKEKGITLIALVVTIIILLILAGVTLNMALSGDGLFNMARKAATDYNQQSVEEKLQILYAEKIMENNDSNTKVKTDVTDVLEEMTEGEITKKDIEEFNKLLEPYNEEVKGITTVDELAKIGQDKEYPIDGVYVQLSDINELTTQIGTEEQPFKGVYNGNGKSIKNLSLTAKENYTGMFRVNEGTVKNVTIENCEITSEKGKVGNIVGENIGLIENCTVTRGDITSIGYSLTQEGTEGGSRIGGICGQNDYKGIISNCKNSASVTGSYRLVGGICGYNYGGYIEKCTNKGRIKGLWQVGGIAGNSGLRGLEFNSSVKISFCTNEGLIEDFREDGNSDSADGGIVGYLDHGSTVENCENKGNVCSKSKCCGGIIGTLRSGDVLNCVNYGNIERKYKYWWNCWLC